MKKLVYFFICVLSLSLFFSIFALCAYADNNSADYTFSACQGNTSSGDVFVLSSGESSITFKISQRSVDAVKIYDTRSYMGQIHAAVGKDDSLLYWDDADSKGIQASTDVSSVIDLKAKDLKATFNSKEQEITSDGTLKIEGEFYTITVDKDGTVSIKAKNDVNKLTVSVDDGSGFAYSGSVVRTLRDYTYPDTMNITVSKESYNIWLPVTLARGSSVNTSDLLWNDYLRFSVYNGTLFYMVKDFYPKSTSMGPYTLTLDKTGGLTAEGYWSKGIKMWESNKFEINGNPAPWEHEVDGTYGKMLLGASNSSWYYTADADGSDVYQFTSCYNGDTLYALIGREELPAPGAVSGDALSVTSNSVDFSMTVQRLTDTDAGDDIKGEFSVKFLKSEEDK